MAATVSLSRGVIALRREPEGATDDKTEKHPFDTAEVEHRRFRRESVVEQRTVGESDRSGNNWLVERLVPRWSEHRRGYSRSVTLGDATRAFKSSASSIGLRE